VIPPLRRALLATGVLLAVDVAGAHLLDAVGVADRLLALGPDALALLPLLVLFLTARLALYFVAPGLVLRAVALSIRARMSLSPSGRPGPARVPP
jgi:hypothetical protein